MNNKFLKLFLFVALFLPLSACSDDKDELKDSEEPTIVGVWRFDFGHGYQLWTFDKNATYSFVEIDYVDGNWSEEGAYTVKDNLLIMYTSEGPNIYTILSLTTTKLMLRYEGEYFGDMYPYDEGCYEVWTRVE